MSMRTRVHILYVCLSKCTCTFVCARVSSPAIRARCPRRERIRVRCAAASAVTKSSEVGREPFPSPPPLRSSAVPFPSPGVCPSTRIVLNMKKNK